MHHRMTQTCTMSVASTQEKDDTNLSPIFACQRPFRHVVFSRNFKWKQNCLYDFDQKVIFQCSAISSLQSCCNAKVSYTTGNADLQVTISLSLQSRLRTTLTCYSYCCILFNNSKHIRDEFLELEQHDSCVLNNAVYARRYNTKFVFMGFVYEVQFFIDFQCINATTPGGIICSQGRFFKISMLINELLDMYIFIGVEYQT